MLGLHMVGVHHSYGEVAVLNNVSLTVPTGELVCLLGPSGCGKTTLLRIAAGLETLQTGSVTIDEEVVAEPDNQLPPERRKIGFMFQDYALFPHLTVLQNVTFGLFRLDRRSARKRAMEVLEQISLVRHADKHPHMLSGGQQQRVALARALAPKPRLVLLDEPFSGLDTTLRAKVREETLSVLKQTDVATLMVTHDPREAMFMADRIKVMGADGGVLQSGRPADIFFKPVDEYVARLFGPVNTIDGVVSEAGLITSFGVLDAPDVRIGAGVQVLIRPEGLILSRVGEASDEAGAIVDILSTHLLGDSSLVQILVREGPNAGGEFQARMSGDFDPTVGGRFRARVDPRHAFVYPRS
jgi:iron(III) transport system ATP-binding protein